MGDAGGGEPDDGGWTDGNTNPDDPSNQNGSNGGGTTTGTGTATTPIITTPVLNIEDEENLPKRKLCEELNAIINKPIDNITPVKTVLTNLNDLKNNVALNKERMYVMTPFTFGPLVNHNSYEEHFAESPSGGDGVSINLGTVLIDIIAHTHWDSVNHLSIFSLEDIYQIYKAINNGNITADNVEYFTTIVITAHNTQYAFKIKDLNTFKTWGDIFFDGWDYPIQSLRDAATSNSIEKTYSDYGISLGNSDEIKAQNEKGIAKFMKDQSLGLELYKSNDTFTQWTKLYMPVIGNTLKQSPCN